METKDYVIILMPNVKGNLFSYKGSASYLLDGMRRQADVVLINCDTAEEVEEILEWEAIAEYQPEMNRRYLQNLINCWQTWEHLTDFSSEAFLDYLARRIRKNVYPKDVLLLRDPVKEVVLEEEPMPFRDEVFKNNHLIVCYPNDGYRFSLVDKVHIQHFDKHNHVILVNSNNPRDFAPFLQEAKRFLEKQEESRPNQRQIEYIGKVLMMLADEKKFYHREPNWKLLHRIKRILSLKKFKMANYMFMVS